jgi:hypothetical protein
MKENTNPSFTRGEYWLLETVVEHAVPIGWLDWEDLEIALNKQGHGIVGLGTGKIYYNRQTMFK